MVDELVAKLRARPRPVWLLVVALVLQAFALLMLLELALAWFHPIRFRQPSPKYAESVWAGLLHRSSISPGLTYELNPGASATAHGVEVAVNSLGFRGREYAVAKPPGTLRIVVMGASVAFGWAVPVESSYPQRLEQRLNERARGSAIRYEVLNFGVGGYSIRDEVAALKAKALALDPDLVVIDYHPNAAETEPVQPLQQVFHETLWWEHWNVLRMLAQARRTWGVRSLGEGDEYRYLNSPAGPHWPVVLAAWDEAKSLCQARGVRVLIPMFPSLGRRTEWSEYPYVALHEQVRQAAVERGFVPVDMFPVYVKSAHNVVDIASDQEHPNALGLDLAAAELERVILEHHQELLGVAAPATRGAPGAAPSK